MALPLHPLVAGHYFSKYFLRLDIMHVIDLKGVIAIAAGSLIKRLMQTKRSLGRIEEERLTKINAQMKKWQADNGTQHIMPPLRKENLTKDNWACMGSKLVKAANSRALVPFLKHLADTHFPAHGSFASSIRKVFTHLDEIERIFYGGGMFLTANEKQELEARFNSLGRHWQNLNILSFREGKNEWQITPKVHMAVHAIAEQARLINPRAVQNYGEESMVGRMTKIWAAAAKGPYQRTAQQMVLARYLVGLSIRLTSAHPNP